MKADVTGTEIVTSTWQPDPGLETAVGKVALRVRLHVEEVLNGAGAEPGDVVIWDIQAWWGDPKFLDAATRDVAEHVKGNPVGATAVVFLAQSTSAAASADGDGSGAWYAVDGLMVDDSRRVRLVAYGPAVEPEGYSDIAELTAAVKSLDDSD
ncbi:MAG: hypothetical protein M5T61_02370 [Acidimicrobiia bacterium]|nr:hypothetical protein [Acidimicrobiia bacterium]